MRIVIDLQERYGRDAQIGFQDRSLDTECQEDVRENLETELQDLIKAFGGLTIAVIEDRLAEVPHRHNILEEVMDLLERYASAKIQERGSLH